MPKKNLDGLKSLNKLRGGYGCEIEESLICSYGNQTFDQGPAQVWIDIRPQCLKPGT